VPKTGSGAVTVFATADDTCCLEVANRKLIFLADVAVPLEVRTLDLDSRATALFVRMGVVEQFRLLVDGAGAFGAIRDCGNRNDTPRCWTYLRRLPSGEAVAYADEYVSLPLMTMDADYVYWTPGWRGVWRVHR